MTVTVMIPRSEPLIYKINYHVYNRNGDSAWVLCDERRLLWAIMWISWKRHEMETCSALQAFCAGNSPVTSEFPSQRPVTQSVDVFFDLRLTKRLSKKSRRRWFETPSRAVVTSLWWTHNNLDMCAYILLPRDTLFRDGYPCYSQKTTLIMISLHWWHQMLSYWQPPPETTKLALWQFLDFQWVIISVIYVDL